MAKNHSPLLLCFSCRHKRGSESSGECNDKATSVNMFNTEGSVDALPFITRNPSVEEHAFKKSYTQDGSVKETISISTASQFGHHPGMGDGGSESLTGWSASHHPDGIDASKINLLISEDSSIILRPSIDGVSVEAGEACYKRLESLVMRLEKCLPQKADSHQVGSSGLNSFQGLMDNEVHKFLSLSHSLGGDIKYQSLDVNEAFGYLKYVLELSVKFCKPSDEEMVVLLQPLKSQLLKISTYGIDMSALRYHQLRTVGDSATALAWQCSATPVSFLQDIYDSTQVYANKVVQSCRTTLPRHVEWVRAWLSCLKGLLQVVQEHYPNGISWNTNGTKPPIPDKEAVLSAPTVTLDTTFGLATHDKVAKVRPKTAKPVTLVCSPQSPQTGPDRKKLLAELSQGHIHLRHVSAPRVV